MVFAIGGVYKISGGCLHIAGQANGIQGKGVQQQGATTSMATEFVHVVFTYKGREKRQYSTELRRGWTRDSLRNVIIAHLMTVHQGKTVVAKHIKILSAKVTKAVTPPTPGI